MVENKNQKEIENESENKSGNNHYNKYKEKIKATTSKWMKDNKVEANRQARVRYANDPELRERIRSKARERAQRIKAQKLQEQSK
jgi:hypothetical protein